MRFAAALSKNFFVFVFRFLRQTWNVEYTWGEERHFAAPLELAGVSLLGFNFVRV